MYKVLQSLLAIVGVCAIVVVIALMPIEMIKKFFRIDIVKEFDICGAEVNSQEKQLVILKGDTARKEYGEFKWSDTSLKTAYMRQVVNFIDLPGKINEIERGNIRYVEERMAENDRKIISLSDSYFNFELCQWGKANVDEEANYNLLYEVVIDKIAKEIKTIKFNAYVRAMADLKTAKRSVFVDQKIYLKELMGNYELLSVGKFKEYLGFKEDLSEIEEANAEAADIFSFDYSMTTVEVPVMTDFLSSVVNTGDSIYIPPVIMETSIADSVRIMEYKVSDLIKEYKQDLLLKAANSLTIEKIFTKENLICAKDSTPIEVILIDLDQQLRLEEERNSRRVKDLSKFKFGGVPVVKPDGSRYVYIFVRPKKLKKYWSLIPFLVFHEVAHHNIHEISVEKHRNAVHGKLEASDELDADSACMRQLVSMDSFKSGFFALSAIKTFEKATGSGGGSHPNFTQRYDEMIRIMNSFGLDRESTENMTN